MRLLRFCVGAWGWIFIFYAGAASAQPVTPEMQSISRQAFSDTECTAMLKSDENIPIENARLLAPIPFKYSLAYRDSCIFTTTRQSHPALECTKPFIRTHPGKAPNTLVSDITFSCQYKQPGIFYSVPIAFDVTSQSTFQGRRLYPPPRKIHVAAFDQNYDPSNPVDTDLEIYRWEEPDDPDIILIWATALTIAAVLTVTAILVLRRKKAPAEKKSAAKAKTPLELFVSEISKLIEFTPATTEEYKQYHDCMSSALRQLIASLFSVDAMNMTTAQLIRTLRNQHFSHALCDETQRILMASDYVKFTLDVPSKAQNVILLRDVRNLAIEYWDFAIRRAGGNASSQDGINMPDEYRELPDTDTEHGVSRDTDVPGDGDSPHVGPAPHNGTSPDDYAPKEKKEKNFTPSDSAAPNSELASENDGTFPTEPHADKRHS